MANPVLTPLRPAPISSQFCGCHTQASWLNRAKELALHEKSILHHPRMRARKKRDSYKSKWPIMTNTHICKIVIRQ
jgi:hypothetical protein